LAESAGAELYAGSQQLLGMAGKSTVVFAIVQQLLRRHGAIEHAQQVLSGDPVARLIIKDGTMGAPNAMNARTIITSGTVSYAPPV